MFRIHRASDLFFLGSASFWLNLLTLIKHYKKPAYFDVHGSSCVTAVLLLVGHQSV